MPDFTAAISLLKKPIEQAYVAANEAVKHKLAGARTAAKVKVLHKRLWQIQRIKTIWNIDRPISLSAIFHPVHVTI